MKKISAFLFSFLVLTLYTTGQSVKASATVTNVENSIFSSQKLNGIGSNFIVDFPLTKIFTNKTLFPSVEIGFGKERLGEDTDRNFYRSNFMTVHSTIGANFKISSKKPIVLIPKVGFLALAGEVFNNRGSLLINDFTGIAGIDIRFFIIDALFIEIGYKKSLNGIEVTKSVIDQNDQYQFYTVGLGWDFAQ